MTTKANEPSKIVVSTRREEPTLGRYRLTDSGALMRLMPDGSWESITPQVDWDRINHTTDAEIERQEIADLVEDALELEAGSFTALAARLQVSPSSVAHQQRLKCLFAAPVNA